MPVTYGGRCKNRSVAFTPTIKSAPSLKSERVKTEDLRLSPLEFR